MDIENQPSLERRLADFVRETDDMFKRFANETYLSMTAKNLPMHIAFVAMQTGFAEQFAKKFDIPSDRVNELMQDAIFLHSFSSIYHFLKEKETIDND